MPASRSVPFISGENSVLAFVGPGALAEVPPDRLACLRAQLRGLGAALVVISEQGRLCLRPDDAPLHAPGPARDFAALCRAWGVQPAAMSGGALSVFVVDARGKLRHAQHVQSQEEPLLILARCLTQALRECQNPRLCYALTRRELCAACLKSGVAMVLASCTPRADKHDRAPAQPQAPASQSAPRTRAPDDTFPVSLRINGRLHELRLPAEASLLDTLRERLGLMGTKKGCDHGQCGACTVLVDDRRVNACLSLAVTLQGKEITTIEGLAHGDALHPMQAAFLSHDGYQCGFCTPGQIMSAVGLMKEGHAQSDAEIREQMSGNLCRCGAYNNILHAIRSAAKAGA